MNKGYQPIGNVDTSKPPSGGSGVPSKRSALTIAVDMKNMDVFKDMLKVTAFLFDKSDIETKQEALQMMEHGDLITVIQSDHP